MRISIVTISFNQAKYLEECIRSVIDQNYDDVEYIVVDPGSTDGSREIIQRYRDRIAHAVLKLDHGPADGLNNGFNRASGDVYYYLNADDLLLDGALRTVADYFKNRPNVDVVLGHGYRLDAKGGRVARVFSSRWSPRGYALGVSNAVQQSTFFRPAIYRAAGGFNVSNRTCWDGELLVDMALKGARIQMLNEYLGAFRVYPESISGSGRLFEAYVRDDRRIREKILGRAEVDRDRYERLLRKFAKHLAHPYQSLLRMQHRAVAVRFQRTL